MRVLPVSVLRMQPAFKSEVVLGSSMKESLSKNEQKRLNDLAAKQPDKTCFMLSSFDLSKASMEAPYSFWHSNYTFDVDKIRGSKSELTDDELKQMIDINNYHDVTSKK